MKRSYIALIFFALVLSGIFAAGAAESITVRKEKVDPINKKVKILLGPVVAIPGATTLYIFERKRTMESIATKNPDAIIEATVSLNSLYSPSEVDNILKNFQVKITGAHFQSKKSDYGGGFKIKENINSSTVKLVEKMKRKIASHKEQLRNLEDERKRMALENIIKIEQELLDEINQGKIGIYAVDVKGSAKEFRKLANHEKVRLVDPKIHEKAEDYKKQGYEIEIIVFPVPPVFR